MSGIVNQTGARSGVIGTTVGSVDLATATFPAGHVIQVVAPTPSVETQSLTTAFTNLYEVSITLKGGNSKVLIMLNYEYNLQNASGLGVKIYSKTSASVTTNDSAIFTIGATDSSGPLTIYYTDTAVYGNNFMHTVTDASSHSAGDTIYYGFFFRVRDTGSGILPPNSPTNGYLSATLMEITA